MCRSGFVLFSWVRPRTLATLLGSSGVERPIRASKRAFNALEVAENLLLYGSAKTSESLMGDPPTSVKSAHMKLGALMPLPLFPRPRSSPIYY